MKQRMKVPYGKGVAIRSASSLALGIARYTAKRRQRIGGVGVQLRKLSIRTPTSVRAPRKVGAVTSSLSYPSYRKLLCRALRVLHFRLPESWRARTVYWAT